MNNNNKLERLYNFITGDEDARVCKDIPETACHHQPKNFFAYFGANVFNKIADELTSAKLVLPWLMGALGAPAALTGLLVPIREAGVLLPQMLVAAAVRHLPRRKGVWLLGGFISALSLALMALVTASLEGTLAGLAIVGLLVLFSVSRGLCSVSAKDVLGKTVSKSRRGVLMGWSAAVGGGGVLVTGLVLSGLDFQAAGRDLFVALFLVSVVLWLLALACFAVIEEQPGATEGGGNAIEVAFRHLALLKNDAPFRRLVVTRILLLAVALAPPYYVLLAQQMTDGHVAGLGWLIIATGLGASLSSPFWGLWGDRCSRCVMGMSALGSAMLGLITVLVMFFFQGLAVSTLFWAAVIFLFTILHSGVRLGRKVYLVDLATAETRAAYVAVSNTVIGIVFIPAGALIGLISLWLTMSWIVLILALISLLAAVMAYRLQDVSA